MSNSLLKYIAKLDQFQGMVVARELSDADHCILRLMREALRKNDIFFIVATLYCAGQTLYQSPVGLFQPPSTSRGLQAFRKFLAFEEPTPKLIEFLSSFPEPVDILRDMIGHSHFEKIQERIARCFESNDREKAFMEASTALDSTSNLCFNRHFTWVEGVSYYILPPFKDGRSSIDFAVLDRPREGRDIELSERPFPGCHGWRSMFWLSLYHGTTLEYSSPCRSQDLSSYLTLYLNNKPLVLDDGSAILDVTNDLQEHNVFSLVCEPSSTKEETDSRFEVVLERCIDLSGRKIIQDCFKKRHIPAREVFRSIMSSLNEHRGSRSEGCEIFPVTRINLFEPFSRAKVFEIPARGIDCRHKDAFDLGTFLETRPPATSSPAARKRAWRCPICSLECTPLKLVIDGFLLNVRKDLAARNLLDSPAILIHREGFWEPLRNFAGPIRYVPVVTID